jgi:hypothetical protein
MTARRVSAGLVLVLCFSLWMLAGSAWAGLTHPFVSSFGSGSLSFPQSIAIDQAGDVYVYDAKNGGSVHKYDSAGAPVSFSSTGTNEIEGVGFNGGGGEEQIAIDNSAGATKGDIYVATGSRVGVYAASGASLGELNGNVEGEVPSTTGTWGGSCGVAVDTTGHVYVGLTSGHVFEYTPSANPVVNTDYASALNGLEATCNVAVDSTGSVYTDTFPAGPVHKYDSLQFGLYLATGTVVSGQGSTIGLDPSDDLYVDQESQVAEYGPGGELIGTSTGGSEAIAGSYGVAASATSVYVADGARNRIDLLGPAVVAADVVLGEATGATTTSEILHGTVNPDGVEVSSCRFEYGTESLTGSAPCSPAPGAGGEPVEVTATATGLSPNTAYEYRLVAENANGQSATSTGGFTTLSTPLITEESPRHVAYESSSLEARIDPMGSPTTYRVEYGTTTAYGNSVPATGSTIGAGSEYVTVEQSLTGLSPGTTYHYRVVAANAYGTTTGEDHTLSTHSVPSTADSCPNAALRAQQHASLLPECRAYEMVSPTDKAGADIAAVPRRTQSAIDGNSIKYISKTAFGDAIGSEAPGAEYIADRGEGGWLTHSINPEQGSVFFATLDPSGYVGVSPDLTKGVFFARTPVLPGHPNVEHLQNLYLRTDLQSAGTGHYELLSDAFAPIAPRKGQYTYAGISLDGASADWSHITFETDDNLTADTNGLDPTLPKLYEWHDGTVTYAGILPDSACGSPPCVAQGSVGGSGAGVAAPSIGGSGEPETPYDWTTKSISTDGSRVVVEANPVERLYGSGFIDEKEIFGNLYMRIDKERTVQLNASERSTPDPRGKLLARFLAATSDDSKVFFETEEALTDDAKAPDNNLYMYDASAPAGKHLTLITLDRETSDDGGGYKRVEQVPQPAISTDGSFIYFLGAQKLIPGQPDIPSDAHALYVWHDGTLRFVTFHTSAKKGDDRRWGESGVTRWAPDDFRMSADGRKIVFDSISRSVAEQAGVRYSGPTLEFYVYDYDTGRITCASCNPDGELATSEPGFETATNAPLETATQHLSNAMSSDGRYVFFDTGDALVAQDTNGQRDVYEYDTQTAEAHLLSDGTCACGATFAEASPDGSNVFFTTDQRLVSIDTDNNTDLYDARVDGGLAAQNATVPPACQGEECRGPAVGAPVFSTPSSASFAGSGNPVAAKSGASPKSRAKRKRPTLAQALKACKRKPKRARAKCRARVRKTYHAKRATRVHASRRAGR